MKNCQSGVRGSTLIELLVVIAIIAILASAVCSGGGGEHGVI
jgi:prepilin-type N-terminal cleavage/methylation domain-containing protein